jgi:hypothetical protein
MAIGVAMVSCTDERTEVVNQASLSLSCENETFRLVFKNTGLAPLLVDIRLLQPQLAVRGRLGEEEVSRIPVAVPRPAVLTDIVTVAPGEVVSREFQPNEVFAEYEKMKIMTLQAKYEGEPSAYVHLPVVPTKLKITSNTIDVKQSQQ